MREHLEKTKKENEQPQQPDMNLLSNPENVTADTNNKVSGASEKSSEESSEERSEENSEKNSENSKLGALLKNKVAGTGSKKFDDEYVEDDFKIINRLDREEIIKKKRRRKKTLRNFAIIFFVALIILTFFSNTIMNYSLPEVTTTTVFSGNVSQKIRCQGSVEISNDMDLTVSGTRTVKEVLVEDGDEVKEGDVIMTFEETENEDLKEAESTLEDLELSYEKSQLRASTDYTDDEVNIQNAKDALADAETALTQAKADEASLATAKTEQSAAQEAYNTKNAEVEGLQAQVDSYQNLEGYTGDVDVDALIAELATAKSELATLEATLNEKNSLVTELSSKTSVADAEDEVTEKSQSLDSLQRGLTSKKQSDSLTAQTNALDDADAVKKIEEQKEKIAKLKEADDCKEIKANGTGIITGITAKAGDKVNAESPIANIQLADSGYVVTCNTTKKDAQMLKVGNEATIENIWSDDVQATIKSIKADTSDPNQKSIVKFAVTGNVQVGETLQFAVGEKSNKYEVVVPNNAVKEDNGGRFVYVVNAKPTPLGNRYIVKKVEVDVVASDTKNSAIQGDLSEYDNVITNASKPLDNGQQVRLTDN